MKINDLTKALGLGEVNENTARTLLTIGFIMGRAQEKTDRAKEINPSLAHDVFPAHVRAVIGPRPALTGGFFTKEMAETIIRFRIIPD
jgi:hypothetical protein